MAGVVTGCLKSEVGKTTPTSQKRTTCVVEQYVTDWEVELN